MSTVCRFSIITLKELSHLCQHGVGRQVVKNVPNLVNVVCERPHMSIMIVSGEVNLRNFRQHINQKTLVVNMNNDSSVEGLLHTFSLRTKGQLISKCIFGVFKSTKKPTNFFFQGFLPWPVKRGWIKKIKAFFCFNYLSKNYLIKQWLFDLTYFWRLGQKS